MNSSPLCVPSHSKMSSKQIPKCGQHRKAQASRPVLEALNPPLGNGNNAVISAGGPTSASELLVFSFSQPDASNQGKTPV